MWKTVGSYAFLGETGETCGICDEAKLSLQITIFSAPQHHGIESETPRLDLFLMCGLQIVDYFARITVS
jgi:hypothetical protein